MSRASTGVLHENGYLDKMTPPVSGCDSQQDFVPHTVDYVDQTAEIDPYEKLSDADPFFPSFG